MEEIINAKCIQNNEIFNATLVLDEVGNTLLRISFNMNEIELVKSAETYFEALLKLRKDLEKLDIKLLLKGCAKNYYPSGMILSMGEGRKAYKLVLHEQAKMDSLVDIFDECTVDEYSTIAEQKAFNEEWFNSVKQ